MNPRLRARLQTTADEIVRILSIKDDQYGSSWKAYGGFSAFFNLQRKWSRIENMSQEQKYDLFTAVHVNPDGPDALKDLVGYSLLTLSETYEPSPVGADEGTSWSDRERLQWLIDNSPFRLEGGGVTFPDGEFWPETTRVDNGREPGPKYVDQDT